MKTGIVTALQAEAACLSKGNPEPGLPFPIDEDLLLVLSGMGNKNVSRAIDLLVAENIKLLLSFGTAGALQPGLSSGDIIIPAHIVNNDGTYLDISSEIRKHVIEQLGNCPAPVHIGDIVSTDEVVATAGDKQALQETTGAIAVDMESALICSAALEQEIPVLVIRVIVDEADASIPAKVLESTDLYGRVQVPRLLINILTQPSLVMNLLKLGSAYGSARRSMQWIGKRAVSLFSSANLS